MRMIWVKNYVAISTVEFTDFFFGYESLCTAIDVPNLKIFTFSVKNEQRNYYDNMETFRWSDLYLSTFFKQRRDFLLDRRTFANSFDSSTLLLHQSWKDSTWKKLKPIQTSNIQNIHTLVIKLPATFPRPSSGAGVDPDGQESKLDLNECVS